MGDRLIRLLKDLLDRKGNGLQMGPQAFKLVGGNAGQ